MSLISQYSQKEQLLNQLKKELQELEDNESLKKELEFKEQLEMLMGEYNKTNNDVKNILFPDAVEEKPAKKPTRKPRKLKVYKNPHTGEFVETRGGNQKTLKAWKEEYGTETVETWLINDDADNQPTPSNTPSIEGNTKQEESKDDDKQEEGKEETTENEEESKEED